jgi:ribosomal protein S18
MKIYTSILIGLLLIASNAHATNTVVTETNEENSALNANNTSSEVVENKQSNSGKTSLVDETPNFLDTVITDLVNEDRLKQNKEATGTDACVLPESLEKVDYKNYSIKELRNKLYAYSNDWRSFQECNIKEMIDTPASRISWIISNMYSNTECEPGTTYAFNEWPTEIMSERSFYATFASCREFSIRKKLVILDKIKENKRFANSDFAKNQSLLNRYIESQCKVTNLKPLEFKYYHPREVSISARCVDMTLQNRIELFMLYMIELNGGVPEDIFDEWYLIGDQAHEAAY